MESENFRQGLKHGLPICLGYFPVSFAYGMSVVLSGMPAWAAVLISLTNLTSAGQFARFQSDAGRRRLSGDRTDYRYH